MHVKSTQETKDTIFNIKVFMLKYHFSNISEEMVIILTSLSYYPLDLLKTVNNKIKPISCLSSTF